MPFLAQCPFCGQKARVPDHAVGASFRCPKCTDFYTLAPVAREPRAASTAHPGPGPGTAVPEVSPHATSPAPGGPALHRPAALPSGPHFAEEEDGFPPTGEPDLVGLAAVLLGAAALGCAVFRPLSGLVVPLGAL